MIGGDAVNPRGKRGGVFELIQAAVGFDEDFLARVVGLGPIAKQGGAKPQDVRVMPADQFRVGFVVPLAGLRYKFGVGDGTAGLPRTRLGIEPSSVKYRTAEKPVLSAASLAEALSA